MNRRTKRIADLALATAIGISIAALLFYGWSA